MFRCFGEKNIDTADNTAAPEDDKFGRARLKHPTLSGKSMSLSGNFVKEFEGSAWDTYDRLDEDILGRGAGGEVVEAVHRDTKRKYAIKIINISNPKFHSLIENEKQILQDLDHLNCVRLYEVYGIGSTQLWFVMELCTGGHLGQFIAGRSRGYMSENTARTYAIQLVSVVAHLHERKICHRDIKLANILMEARTKDAPIKLIDFGNSSRFKTGVPMKRIAGTTYSTAPEVFQRRGYNEKCDVWSVGVMVYIMLCGRRPYERIDIPHQPEASEASLISSILLGRYHFDHAPFKDVSDHAIHFICSCFDPFPDRRNSAHELMHHPWLTDKDLPMDDFSVSQAARFGTTGQRYLAAEPTSGDQLSVAPQALQANYMNKTSFNRTSMLGVAFSIPPAKTRLLRKTFMEMDTDKTGYLDRNEFFAAVKKSSMLNPDIELSDEVNMVFDTIDIDGNNQISFIEFIAATIDPRSVDIQDLNQAFRLIDKEEKGYISVDDFKLILETASNQESHSRKNSLYPKSDENVGSTRTSSDENGSKSGFEARVDAEHRAILEEKYLKELESNLARMIAEVDVDGDGKVSYTEFLFAMSELPKTGYYVPPSKQQVLQNENMDNMHRRRHLARAASENMIVSQLSYKNSNFVSQHKNDKASSKKAPGSGLVSIFSRVFSSRGSKKVQSEAAHQGGDEPASKFSASSSAYFTQTRALSQRQAPHADINWAVGTSDKRDMNNKSIDFLSDNNAITVKRRLSK